MKLVKIVIVCVVAVVAVAWGMTAYLSVDDLRNCGDVPSSEAGCHAADAVVAISGGDTTARTAEAIALYKNGWGSVLILSGAAADKSGPSNAEVMKQQALSAGVPANVIVIDEASETTAENAQASAGIFAERSITSAILVTSAYHERRAMLEFSARADGVELRGHPVAEDNQWRPMWWLTPTGWILAVSETVHSLLLSISGGSK